MSPLLAILTLVQALPSFEVASVKPVQLQTDSYNINLGKTNHGELTLGNATLSDCLKFAYGLNSDIQLAGPDWINKKGEVIFDIVGKAPDGTPRDQLLLMLQRLLTERFRMTVHREQRQASYLALIPAKKGLKIEELDPDAPPIMSNTFHLGHIETKGVYIPVLATVLSRFMRQPVIDMTGLKGRYAMKVDWAPDPVDVAKSAEPAGPTIYTALQEQAGLKLEARKGPVEVLVIDHAERVPISN